MNQAARLEPSSGDSGVLAPSVSALGCVCWILMENGPWAGPDVMLDCTVPSGLAHSNLFNYSKDYPITIVIQI
jgi:hypothetical protein